MTVAPNPIGRRAVILAGGKGTRLRPFTTILPKPLLPVGDRAIVEIIIAQLGNRGFTQVTLAVGYLSHLIRAVLGDRPFLMMNGDVITTLDYGELMLAHESSGNALTIATQVRTATIDFGVLEVAGREGVTDTVVGYREKPHRDYVVSMGVYVISPSVLRLIEPGAHLDFPDLVLRAIAAGERVGSYRYDGLWLDIGRHEDYERAIAELTEIDGLLGI